MLYPPTVDDETALEADDSSDEEVDECVQVRRKKKKAIAADFNDSFVFEAVTDDQNDDDLAGVRPYLRKNVVSTLQEKIDRERAKFMENNAVEIDLDESLVQEKEETVDQVRDKPKGTRKKKTKKDDFFDTDASKAALSSACSLSFTDMNLSRPLLKAIDACGFIDPTPIQAACIPLALAGRDLCACAATGTGKTAAFMLPILERLLFKPRNKHATRVLVLVPTRELAIQVFQVSRKLSQFCNTDICLCAGKLFARRKYYRPSN
ncbi:hypothetical protein AB6A40_005210 [Gnathostoma spinigerum]|uniref:RNA helicase n=1 Tax=Gnathostoma spinigerum TaxID=75299 RepID=A0ABD6EFP3_9BILA